MYRRSKKALTNPMVKSGSHIAFQSCPTFGHSGWAFMPMEPLATGSEMHHKGHDLGQGSFLQANPEGTKGCRLSAHSISSSWDNSLF